MPTSSGRATQHTYRERAQPNHRKRFGLLEKKKDWSARAKDHKQKREQILKLKRTAENKNPDEFYFGMVGKRMKGGKLLEQQSSLDKSSQPTRNKLGGKIKDIDNHNPVFKTEEEEDEYLDHLLKKAAKKQPKEVEESLNFDDPSLLKNKDYNFVQLKFQKEKKKLQRMKDALSFSQASGSASNPSNTKSANSHLRFASDDEEAEEIQATIKQRKAAKLAQEEDFENFRTKSIHSQTTSKKLLTQYREMSEQIQRVRQIKTILEKLDSRRKVATDARSCKVLEGETEEDAGSYFWPTKRYR